MHTLSLYRIKAISPKIACEKANELLNPGNASISTADLSDKTLNAIKKTELFTSEFDGDIEECLSSIFNIKNDIIHEIEDELIELGFKKEAKAISNKFGDLMDNSSLYSYTVIGCLSENNDAYVINTSKIIRWSPENETIQKLNSIYQKDLGDFNVLIDLNEIEPDEDDTIPLWELNYKDETGEIYIVFVDLSF
jgi:hypothetical protein